MKEINGNPFEAYTGASVIRSTPGILLIGALILSAAFMMARQGLATGMMFLVLPFMGFYFFLFFRFPHIGIYSVVFIGFILLGIHRYISGIQFGPIMDGLLVFSFIALFFNRFYQKVDFSPARRDIAFLAALWAAYGLLQFFNPEMNSVDAYMSTIRGISLYFVMIVVLALLFINTPKRVDTFFIIWAVISMLASIKGIGQIWWKPDPWEQAWLNAGAASNHLVFGKLRVFSFMSDAGQFGANQAYSGVVFLILVTAYKERKKKIFFLIAALLAFYGMFLSGTRGAMTVPFAGFVLYSLVKKNWSITISVLLILAVAFGFFKYTTIGQNIDQIRRMRTAFDPNDRSFQLRLANQRKLRTYMATRPFGGGIGHAGTKAKKYNPYAFLSNTATDSWYVMIWAEQGVVGLILHLFILFYVLIKASYKIMFKIRDPILKKQMTALASGMMGVMVSSYGNAVLGSMPTGMLIYISMALMTHPEVLEPAADKVQKQLTS